MVARASGRLSRLSRGVRLCARRKPLGRWQPCPWSRRRDLRESERPRAEHGRASAAGGVHRLAARNGATPCRRSGLRLVHVRRRYRVPLTRRGSGACRDGRSLGPFPAAPPAGARRWRGHRAGTRGADDSRELLASARQYHRLVPGRHGLARATTDAPPRIRSGLSREPLDRRGCRTVQELEPGWTRGTVAREPRRAAAGCRRARHWWSAGHVVSDSARCDVRARDAPPFAPDASSYRWSPDTRADEASGRAASSTGRARRSRVLRCALRYDGCGAGRLVFLRALRVRGLQLDVLLCPGACGSAARHPAGEEIR